MGATGFDPRRGPMTYAESVYPTVIVKLTHAARDVGQPDTWELECPQYTPHGVEGIETQDRCQVLIPWASVAYVLK